MSVTVTLVGRLARDPEQRQSNSGNSYYLQVSVAGNEGYGDNQETFFFSARFFGKRADSVVSYRKGDLVRLDGHLHEYTSQNGKTYKELQYAEIELLQRKYPQNNQQGGYPQVKFNQPQSQPQQAPEQMPQSQQFNNAPSNPQQAQTAPQGNQIGNYQNQGKNAPQGFSNPDQGYSQEDMPF